LALANSFQKKEKGALAQPEAPICNKDSTKKTIYPKCIKSTNFTELIGFNG